eukprot:3787836-Amphidinium_carterae.1
MGCKIYPWYQFVCLLWPRGVQTLCTRFIADGTSSADDARLLHGSTSYLSMLHDHERWASAVNSCCYLRLFPFGEHESQKNRHNPRVQHTTRTHRVVQEPPSKSYTMWPRRPHEPPRPQRPVNCSCRNEAYDAALRRLAATRCAQEVSLNPGPPQMRPMSGSSGPIFL